jgi:adenylate kinase family enzyme
MQGFVTKLTVSTARRLSNGSLPALPSVSSRMASNSAARRHSICAFESVPRGNLEWKTTSTPNFPAPVSNFPREITWLAGAPGAGKGTNSSYVASARGYDAPTIVMSSLLDSPECKRIKDAGGMVNDEVVFKALLQELAKPEYRRGVVVDGFPRTEKQAAMISELHENLSSNTSFNFVTLFIDEQASVARQLSRGEVIRKLNTVRKAGGLPPLEERTTDVCEKAARLRYSNFMQQYEAINKLSARFPLAIVDAAAPIDTVRQRLSAVCSTLPTPRPPRNARAPSHFSPLSTEQPHLQQQMAAM